MWASDPSIINMRDVSDHLVTFISLVLGLEMVSRWWFPKSIMLLLELSSDDSSNSNVSPH